MPEVYCSFLWQNVCRSLLNVGLLRMHRIRFSQTLFTRDLLMLVLLVGMAGCGGGVGDRPSLGRVSGQVTLDNSPVEGAELQFRPVDGGRPSSGVTDAQGRYTLIFSENVNGAVIGQHTVSISTGGYKQQPDGSTTESPEQIPARYNTETSLTREVQSGANEINFELESQ